MNNKKVVIVTGGSRGIGYGITKAFIDNNYIVVVGSRQDRDLSKQFGDNVRFIYTDVRYEKYHLNLVETTIHEFGRLDCFINNAGYSKWKPIEEINEEFLTDIIDTNLKGAFWGSKIASKYLNKEGTIINVSSLAGKRGSSNNSAYVASKFGMNGLTQSLSKELGPKGIRVNAVCPVLINTEGLNEALMDKSSPGNGDPKKFINEFTRLNSPLLRMPTSLEVGKTCVFLASESASAITGQCINVDCGVLPQ